MRRTCETNSLPSDFDTVSKRAKLPPSKNPRWQGVSGGRGGVSLGYRRTAKGAGSWIAKIVVEGNRFEEKIGLADDDGAPAGALNYKAAVVAALEWSHRQQTTLAARKETGGTANGPTVRTAVEAYAAARSSRSAREGKMASGRLARHVLSDAAFADMPLSKLRASTIQAWRSRLVVVEEDAEEVRYPIAKATVNRLLNDLRAALNGAAEEHRRELPPHLPAEIRIGTRAETVTGQARKQLLSDEQVRAAIAAAYEVDPDGDFGRLVLVAAATGARYSQLAALTVGSVQPGQGRIMLPGSKKGRAATARTPVAVPLSPDLIARLEPAIAGRKSDEPLLTRWSYKNVGPFKWEKDQRRALGSAYEIGKQWAAVVAKAGLPPGTIMYALRHSSIVRGLRAGLPVRLVASLHDTSTVMIEKHYAAFIVDMTEELSRRAALSIA